MTEHIEVDILLVEDDPGDAEMTIRTLRKHNLANRLVHVKDGAEALEFLFPSGQEGSPCPRPKVVLLDLKLPKVSGIEVLRRIKANPLSRTIPVVVLTSSQEQPDLEECYRLGVNSYVVKPVDFAQFDKAVEELGLFWLLINRPL